MAKAKIAGDYRYKVKRLKTFGGPHRKKHLLMVPSKKEESLPVVIQGKKVGSKEEAREAIALKSLGYDYIYQYPIFGGDIRGGQKIDFLVMTMPLPTPLYVQSRYWHGGAGLNIGTKDALNQARVRSAKKGQWAEPKEIWDNHLQSIEQAIMENMRMFGRK